MNFNSKQQLRIDILSKFIAGNLHYLDAMELLEVKERQFRRQVKAFKLRGIESVLHGNTFRKPPNRVPDKIRNKIIRLYKGRFSGLNLTHFREKLMELELEYVPSYSTIRNILIKEKLFKTKIKRNRRVHPMRKRYAKEGMMVQIDGSHHRWINNQLPICLTLAMDDATGKILGAKFTKTETTFAAMDVLEKIVKEKGRFQMLYSDKAGIYGGGKREGFSQMNRALKELDILSIQANTPQAKGRVERVFRTLQSRLVSELRLRNIQTIEQANQYLEMFIDEFNKKFGVTPYLEEKAYKKISDDIDLEEVFCMKMDRIIGEGNIVSYKGEKWLLNLGRRSYHRENVEIREYRNGNVKVLLHGNEVNFEVWEKRRVA